MEIIFIPNGLAETLLINGLEGTDSIELEDVKNEIHQIDSSVKFKEVNLGTNADWIAVLAIINGITSVLLVGDKIVKGIDGWINLAKRIKGIFSRSEKVYIDKDTATILAIEHLSRVYKIESIEKLNENIIALKDLSQMLSDRTEKDFIAKPFNVYFMTFKINDDIIISLGIRSDGEIKELYSFDDISLPIEPF